MATVHGLPACSCLVDWIPDFEADLGRYGIKVRFTQLNGSYGPSAGTHKAGAFDLVVTVTGPRSLNAAYALIVKIARQMGADATWERPYNWDRRGGIRHTHGILTGCPHLSWQAKSQQAAVKIGRNGLANLGKDTGPRPLSGRTYKQGIAWAKARAEAAKPKTTVKVAHWNLPAPGVGVGKDLPDPKARIEAAAKTISVIAPHLVGWNELAPIKSAGVASDFARDLDAALGAKWLLVKPTLPWNENYISFDRDKLKLVKQYNDAILPSASGGRHITRAVFEVKATGFVFAVGQTHLVNGAKGEKDRQAQAAKAHHYMLNVTEHHDDCPFLIQGDMNTHAALKALVDAGMKNVRQYADTVTGGNYATYTGYDKTKPSTNTDWVIDACYVSPGFYALEYAVRTGTVGGVFTKPRPSDHLPIISTIRDK